MYRERCKDLGVRQVEVQAVLLDRLDPFLTGERAGRLHTAAGEPGRRPTAGVVWNINATSHGGGGQEATFARRDGSVGWLRPHTDLILDGAPLPPEVRLVVQVSHWDRLKDMAGVLTAFSRA